MMSVDMGSVRLSTPDNQSVKPDNLVYCLRNLLASDIAAVGHDQSIRSLSQANLQLLCNQLHLLPNTRKEESMVTSLPPATFKLPRSQPVPENDSRPKTRWEKFAQEKGIVKRKRSRMVFDEATESYAPRYGAYSIKKREERGRAIIELKPGEDPNADPFEKISTAKSSVKAKQKYREMRNQIEGIAKQHLGPSGLQEILRRSQYATASMGTHDNRAIGEKMLPQVKRRKVKPSSVEDEQSSTKKMVQRMLSSGNDVVDRNAVSSHSKERPLDKDGDKAKKVASKRSRHGGKGRSSRGQLFTKKAKSQRRKAVVKGKA
eukprot:GHVN01079933.1.p1 GENE.GHVN01079933.1~~GHVN01079933.1.p1  ORF type:complete len:318 (+),score=42.72 GHVN01079933.1:272-1225(+)